MFTESQYFGGDFIGLILKYFIWKSIIGGRGWGGGGLSSGEKLILVLIHFLITCMHVSHSKEASLITY